MRPIGFRGCNETWGGKDYRPLPARTTDKETITCWQLTWYERLYVLVTGRFWLIQLNFGEPLQPQCPSVQCPFEA